MTRWRCRVVVVVVVVVVCSSIVACAGKPIAPVGPLTIHAYSYDSVTLSWRAPEGADAWSVTGYRVEKREVSRQTWEVVSCHVMYS